MRQGMQVIQGGAGVMIAPNHADMRMVGAQMEDELREAVTELGDTLRPKPDPELLKSIRPTRGRSISASTIFAGVATLANDKRIAQPAWNRFRGRVVGSLDALVTPIPTDFMAAYIAETHADGLADVEKISAPDAIRTRNVPAMRRIASAIRAQIAQAQECAAHLDVCINAALGVRVRSWS